MSPVPSNDNGKKPSQITTQTVITVLQMLIGLAASSAIGAKYPELFAYLTANLPVIVPAVVTVGVAALGIWGALRKQLLTKAANQPGATVVLDNHAEANSINNASVVPAPATVTEDKKAA